MGFVMGSMLPSSNGHYLVYSHAMRKHCGKEIGDNLHVTLEVDDQPRELELPEDVAPALNGTEAAMEKFSSLPYYIRRDEINKIDDAKTQPTRGKRIQALLDRLLG
ncbi:MAG: YdeI/OmpD-associated family protein [Armatimonadota bacterium]